MADAGAMSGWRSRLGWVASIGLAVVVMCSGCCMLFAFALTARGELEAPLLGSDWRVWQLQQRGTNGIGVSQTTAFPTGQLCRHVRVWLIQWRPALQIETSAYIDCEAASRDSAPVARERRSVIITSAGVWM